MKKILSALLLLTIAVSLCACSDTQKVEVPVYFYYPAKTVSYGTQDGVITPEKRESKDFINDPTGLLNLYLQGPADNSLQNPFPKELSVRSYAVLDTEVILELSPQFSEISGLDLTLACASLGKTIFRMTDTEKVTIFTEGIAQPQVIYAKDLLFEDVPSETTTPKE